MDIASPIPLAVFHLPWVCFCVNPQPVIDHRHSFSMATPKTSTNIRLTDWMFPYPGKNVPVCLQCVLIHIE